MFQRQGREAMESGDVGEIVRDGEKGLFECDYRCRCFRHGWQRSFKNKTDLDRKDGEWLI